MIQRSFLLSLFIAAALISGLVFFLHTQNEHFDLLGMTISNILFALVSLVSFYLVKKGLKSSNGYAFVRAKYTAMLLKFFFCIAIIVGYIFWVGRANIYKPSIFLLLGMYVVYGALEAFPLSKLAKSKV